MEEVNKRANERRSFVFLDDFLIRGTGKEGCRVNLQILQSVLVELGLNMNMEKSKLEPCQELEYIGKVWNTKTGEVKNVGTKVESTA